MKPRITSLTYFLISISFTLLVACASGTKIDRPADEAFTEWEQAPAPEQAGEQAEVREPRHDEGRYEP